MPSQSVEPSNRQTHPEYSLAVELPLVAPDVLVTDEDGNVLRGLARENFRVLDQGRPQVITGFGPISTPLTIVMLLEYSGLSYGYFAYNPAAWGVRFLDHLEENDWVALVTYDIQPTVQVDFPEASRKSSRLSAASPIHNSGRQIYMKLYMETLDQLEPIEGKRAILLIGTGADTFTKITLDDIYDRLRQTGVTVFAIGVAESEYLNAELRGGSNIGYMQIKNQLQTFANLTGGFAWFPRFEGELLRYFPKRGRKASQSICIDFLTAGRLA